ncbi:MAG: TAXI family TRAP transporter solute-binding subunit [Isosphaeraceae bacterium]|nr:TAXI family TRAP transporter solute-binding subunit [Isosphaeraceae bacterium]
MTQSPRAGRRLRRIRDGLFAVLGVLGLALAVHFAVREPTERLVRLSLSAGQAAGERRRIAEVLLREALARSIEIRLVETEGSAEALEAVDAGRLDAALAQGGLDLSSRRNLRQVATLHIEPLHLLVKEELHAEVAGRLSALKGKSIGIGEPGSGTARLSLEVLRFAGLDQGDFHPDPSSYQDLLTELDRSKLPDAVFMVSTLPSPVARRLVERHRYRLVELPFHEAFTLGPSETKVGDPILELGIDRRNVVPATIPAFAYEIEPGVPPETIDTLGTRLILVANVNVPERTIQRLVEVVYTSPFGQVMRPALDARLLEMPPEAPWHRGTLSYLHRNAPLIAGDLLDLIEKELSIVGAMCGAGFFLWQWVRRRYRRVRDQGFESYILRVNRIERRAIVLEREPVLDLQALTRLQEELSDLKGDALDKFIAGELEGEELMSSFLTHVADTRDFLTNLIIAARELRARTPPREDPAGAASSELVPPI